MNPEELEQLYQQARAAFKTRNYNRASDLFRQILQVDENYRDASRLLAQTVKLRRRRWYNHPLLSAGLGLVALLLIGIWIAPLMKGFFSAQISTPDASSTYILSSLSPRLSPRPTSTPMQIPTPVPLTWKRIYIGQQFPRDSITAIVVDPKDPEVLYVGTENAGIYKSIDSGLSWQPVQNGLVRAPILSLEMDPNDPQILYAGTDQGGVFRTTDGGKTWRAANTGITLPGWNGASIVIMDGTDSHHLFFSHGFGLYESINSAETWVQLNFSVCQDGYPTGLAIDPGNALNIYIFLAPESGCTGGIYTSNDGGINWNYSGLKNLNLRSGGLLIDPKEGNTLYAITENETYRSTDRGETWKSLTQGVCKIMAIDPFNPKIIYCDSYGSLAMSQNSGDDWIEITTLKDFNPRTITVTSGNPNLIFVGGQGLYLSNDNLQTWNERDFGIGGGYLELHMHPTNGSILFAEHFEGTLYRSTDSGHSWEVNEKQGKWLVFDPPGDNLYRASYYPIFVSHDNGDTWIQLETPVDNPGALGSSTDSPGSLYLAPADWGWNKPIYTSSNGGVSWTQFSGFIPGGWPRFVFGDNQGKRIYFIGDVASVRSDDGGLNWQDCAQVGIYSKYGPRFTIDPRNPDHIFLSTRVDGVFESMDGCASWRSSNNGLDSLYVNVVAMDPNSPDTLYAGTDSGAYVSYNNGKTWGQINDGLLGATVVYSIVVDKDSNVFAATPYGIFKLENR